MHYTPEKHQPSSQDQDVSTGAENEDSFTGEVYQMHQELLGILRNDEDDKNYEEEGEEEYDYGRFDNDDDKSNDSTTSRPMSKAESYKPSMSIVKEELA